MKGRGGAPYVMIPGQCKMLMLLVGCWDLVLQLTTHGKLITAREMGQFGWITCSVKARRQISCNVPMTPLGCTIVNILRTLASNAQVSVDTMAQPSTIRRIVLDMCSPYCCYSCCVS